MSRKKVSERERRRFMAELERDRPIFSYPRSGLQIDMPHARRKFRRFLLIEVGIAFGLAAAVGIYKLFT